MEMLQGKNLKLEIRRQLFWLLKEIEGEDHSRFVILHYEDARLLKEEGLLQPYGGFDSIDMGSDESTDTLRLLVSGQMAEGKRVVRSDGGFCTIEIRALKKLVSDLYRDRTVDESTHREEHKPQEQAQKWQGYVAPKYEDTVLVAVRVEEDIRDKFHAVMRAKNTTAQEFLSDYIVQQVNKHPDLVKQGEHMDAAGTKKNYRTKLRILKEENARLRAAGHTGKSSRSR